jgi:REP element-mobilizing transposase RayT
MQYNPQKHHRCSTRLQGYDYAQAGAYFVTICTKHRALFFQNQAIQDIAAQCWLAIPDHFPVVELDTWVIMPNHVHGIIVIVDSPYADRHDPPRIDCAASQRTGVQLNAPTTSDDSHRSDEGRHDSQRTGVQLNAPAAPPCDPSADRPASLGVQLNAPAAPPCDSPAQQRTGVQLNAPARDPANRFSVMSPHRDTLAVVVRTYKAAVTTLCRRAGYDYFVWQRNYHEHVIRSEEGLNRVRQYILDNPAK